MLHAPKLRDDYYISILAYDVKTEMMAVALDTETWLWQADKKPRALPDPINHGNAYITCIAFAGPENPDSILAVARINGILTLSSPEEKAPRFSLQFSSETTFVSFRPKMVKRGGRNGSNRIPYQDLVVGQTNGIVDYFCLDWRPKGMYSWNSSKIEHAFRILAHEGSICTLNWSLDGRWIASGGNDNRVYVHDTHVILGSYERLTGRASRHRIESSVERAATLSYPTHEMLEAVWNPSPDVQPTEMKFLRSLSYARSWRHCWWHESAVKAIAFCPWEKKLVATGGGNADMCIHFWNMKKGNRIAKIKVHAQVTGLVWSKTSREIAATLRNGKDHRYRIAVFSWPACETIVKIEMNKDDDIICAISVPTGPNMKDNACTEGQRWSKRTKLEGSLVSASTEGLGSIKFHEIWAGEKKDIKGGEGVLGGGITEMMSGVDLGGMDILR